VDSKTDKLRQLKAIPDGQKLVPIYYTCIFLQHRPRYFACRLIWDY